MFFVLVCRAGIPVLWIW